MFLKVWSHNIIIMCVCVLCVHVGTHKLVCVCACVRACMRVYMWVYAYMCVSTDLCLQELLSLFGVPYIISPCEAEAQCAQLDYTGQVSGTVTDDSDYFLFGGKQAFRSFFSTNRDIDCYKDEVIQQTLGKAKRNMYYIYP